MPHLLKNRLTAYILLALFATLPLVASAPAAFDEMFDADGKVRYEYEGFLPLWEKLSAAEKEDFLQRHSLHRFQKDNRLYHAPKIFNGRTEYDPILVKGFKQRVLAMQMFLRDHYSGKKTYLNDQRFPKSVFANLLRRTGDIHFDGAYNVNQITGLMGLDIVRGPDGRFYVLEDNPGWIGGPGDLPLATELMRELFPELEKTYRLRDPLQFYREVTALWKKEAGQAGGNRVVHYTMPPYPDNEDARMKKIYADYGIITVTPRTRLGLTVRKDGVYLVDRKNRKAPGEKVGLVVLNGEHKWLDLSHDANLKQAIEAEARFHLEEDQLDPKIRAQLETLLTAKAIDHEKVMRALQRSNYLNEVPETRRKTSFVAGLTDAILDGRVRSSYSPGIDFIGDKEFYLYAEELIRLYLKEEPILRNVPTKRMSEVDRAQIYENYRKYVIKVVDGRGGEGVLVGPKATEQELAEMRVKVEKNPANFIVQEYMPLSTHDGNIGDVRMIGYMAAEQKDLIVSSVPWARGLEPGGNGKVNLSDKGFEVTAMVMDGYWRECRTLFKTTPFIRGAR